MSERTLDSDLKTSAQSSHFKYVVFVELGFDGGTVYTHNGIGTITWGGNDWLGVGTFGSIDMLQETTKLVDNPVNLMLSSITPEVINEIKDEDIYQRDAVIYVGAINEADELIGTPTTWVVGYMEHATLAMGNQNGISISIQTRAAQLKRKNNKRYTLEDHQEDYPGDLFLEFLPEIKELQVPWAGEDSVVYNGVVTGSGLPGTRVK